MMVFLRTRVIGHHCIPSPTARAEPRKLIHSTLGVITGAVKRSECKPLGVPNYSYSYSKWSGLTSLTPLWEPNEAHGAELTS